MSAERARSFGAGVDVYAATRPGYPDDAVRWAVPPGARTVLDLAAGTGKLTASLVGLVPHVLAVEPTDEMRAELQRTLPDVPATYGTAEATGLPDASVDAVTVGQAWHWFDQAAASAELARVLRPGGQLTVLWNIRDESEPWVAEFSRIVHRGDDLADHFDPPVLGDDFGPLEAAEFHWVQRIPTAALRPLAASRSFLLTMPPDEREARLAEIDDLVATHPDLAGEHADQPYVTRAYRAFRR